MSEVLSTRPRDTGLDNCFLQGRLIEGIYFQNPRGKEDKKGDRSIVVHQGDNLHGKGEGFGFKSEAPRKKEVGPAPIKDDERIEIRQLAKLRQHQPRCAYMFFVINVFTSQHKFEHVQDLTIRIVDEDSETGETEICRFQKKDMRNNKCNAFVLGVLFWRIDRWVFQVVDENFQIKDFATYREFEPQLRKIVRTMEGLD